MRNIQAEIDYINDGLIQYDTGVSRRLIQVLNNLHDEIDDLETKLKSLQEIDK